MNEDEEYEYEEDESTGLGLERWVQFAFVLIAIATFYVVDKTAFVIWEIFAEPDTTVVSAIAAVAGVLAAYTLYKNTAINDFAHEVAEELSMVTWPTKEETYSQTVVVIITSIVSAILLGMIDFFWSKLTDIIYTV